MKKEVKAVIFDKDGVLVDSEETNVQAAVDTFKSLGINLTPKDKKQIFGRHPEDYKHYFLIKYKFSYEEFRKKQRENYYNLYDFTKPNKLIINLIKKLHKNKVRLALTTTSSRDSTLKTIKSLGLDNVFEVIVTFEDVVNRKPSPDPYLKTLERLNLSPEEVVVVEDSPPGVESAKAAKVKCIAFKTPYVEVKELAKADLISNSKAKIEAYLKSLGVKI
jgi:beta-phosphoglucomutase